MNEHLSGDGMKLKVGMRVWDIKDASGKTGTRLRQGVVTDLYSAYRNKRPRIQCTTNSSYPIPATQVFVEESVAKKAREAYLRNRLADLDRWTERARSELAALMAECGEVKP